MIPERSILEKGKELVAIAKRFDARNIRFFGEVVSDNPPPRPNCGVDILVDSERGKDAEGTLSALKSAFEAALGRQVGVKTPDMVFPPNLRNILETEVVHLDVLLDLNDDHLRNSPVDPVIIAHRLELLAIAKRYNVINLRLAGNIVREGHAPDCRITILAEVDHIYSPVQCPFPLLEWRFESILKRTVNLINSRTCIPPLSREALRGVISL